MYGVAAANIAAAIVDDACCRIGVAVCAVEAGSVVGSEVGGIDTASAARGGKDRCTVAIVGVAEACGILLGNGVEVEFVVRQWVEAGKDERRASHRNRGACATSKT